MRPLVVEPEGGADTNAALVYHSRHRYKAIYFFMKNI